jgi:hypothetical protein
MPGEHPHRAISEKEEYDCASASIVKLRSITWNDWRESRRSHIATSITAHPIAIDDDGVHFEQHPNESRGRAGVRYRKWQELCCPYPRGAPPTPPP